MEKSGNPALNDSIFAKFETTSRTMSRGGTYAKTFVLLVALVCSAAYTWQHLGAGSTSWGAFWLIAMGTFIIGMLISIKPSVAPILSLPYALAEGALLGGISAIYAQSFDGIVQTAIVLTLAIFTAVWLGYSLGFLRATAKFVKVITFALLGVLVYYVFAWIIGLMGLFMPKFTISALGPWGIILSLAIIVIAALSLVMDFDFIDRAAEAKAPKTMEWYGAFGLMVGLIWLYLEILRLLARIAIRSQN